MKIRTAFKTPVLLLATLTVAMPLLISSVPARSVTQEDAAAVYKAKCLMCHGANADKKFDATKPDAELIEITLKGKKVEKPPHMPGYAEKGMTTEQATDLVNLMKAKRQ